MIPWRSVFVVAIVVCDYFCCRCLPFPVLVRLLPDRPPHSPFPRSSSPPPRIPSPLRALFLPVIPFSLPPRGPRFVCREGRAINTRLFVTKEPAAPFCVRALGPPSRYCEVATGVPGRCPAFGDQRAGNNEGYAHVRGKCANGLRWPARLVARNPKDPEKERKTGVVLTQNPRCCAKCAFPKKYRAGLPWGQFSGPWLFSTAEARASKSSSSPKKYSHSKAFKDIEPKKKKPSPLVFIKKKGEKNHGAKKAAMFGGLAGRGLGPGGL